MKLVATVLAMLTIALALIGVASTMFLRQFMTDDLDERLADISANTRHNPPRYSTQEENLDDQEDIESDIVFFPYPADDSKIKVDLKPHQPTLLEDRQAALEHLGTPYTVRSVDGSQRWRMLVSTFPNGRVFVIGMNQSAIDKTVGHLVAIDLIGGIGVLLLAASIGATLVQQTLRPLKAIERTAGAIAAGDLTRRVPDPEEGEPEALTEVGSLARSLNSMLAQIETAFTARAASESAARAAEVTARDAAVAAQTSEGRARRSEERMRRFVADASHELRTPLTTIRGFAELFRQGAVTPNDVAGLVKRIEDEARRMGLLVEDLLMLARMDQERPLQPAPVELKVLAVDAVQAAQVLAPDRSISLEIESDTDELLVIGDDARLRQVVSNLMSNALAHTPAGTPIEVRLRAEGQQGVLEIADHGPGLTAGQQERVFERFYRADAARTRRADGHVSTGLGLAIVAALVAAHEGTVEVDSEPGHGATFRVRLPLVELDDEHVDLAEGDGVGADSGLTDRS